MTTENTKSEGSESLTASGALKWVFMGIAGCLVAHTVINIFGLWGVSNFMGKSIVAAFNSAVSGGNVVDALLSPQVG